MTEERGATRRLKASCKCEACKRSRKEPNKIKSGTVHSYSSTPDGGWKFRRTVQEIIADPNLTDRTIYDGRRGFYGARSTNVPLFMGIELETDVPAGSQGPVWPVEPRMPRVPYGTDYETARQIERDFEPIWLAWNDRCRSISSRWHSNNNVITAESATSLARPGAFWYPKHDSSVSGPEFVSMPATMPWWNSRQESMRRMFDGLLHAGMRSHSGDHCGMHINMNTSAFESASHLFNMLSLMQENKTWALKMSQRTLRSSHWANFENSAISYPTRRLDWARRVIEAGYASQDRYGVFNASNEGRVEFRLPRGTLRIDRFYKNLEWTVSMFEYAKQSSPSLKPADYMKWALARRVEYPNLCAFLDEKFSRTAVVKQDAVLVAAGRMA